MPSYQENLLKTKLIKLFSSFLSCLYSQEVIERTEFYNSRDYKDQASNPNDIFNQAVFKEFQKEKRYTTKTQDSPYNSIFSIQILLHFALFLNGGKNLDKQELLIDKITAPSISSEPIQI